MISEEKSNSFTQVITIELWGQSYTFRAETDVSKAKEIADSLVKEVAKAEIQLTPKSPMIPKQTILILAALNIAGENYNLKKNHSDLLQHISERSTNLMHILERCFQ